MTTNTDNYYFTKYYRAKNLSNQLVCDCKYLYDSQVIGLLATLILNYNLPLSQEVIDGVKDSLIDYFFDGMDPEWEDYGIWKWFEGLNPDWFKISPDGTQLLCNKHPKDFKENEQA